MAALAGPALAQDFVESVIAQLRKQGFQSVIEERTLLGRVRLTATRGDGVREIIINPKSGEILRDLWTPTSSATGTVQILEDKSGSPARDDDKDDSDSEGSDDGNDDADGDDGEDGGGGDNSGSGGGDKSGSGGDDDDDDGGDDDGKDDGGKDD